jgi:hypothetical protein
MLRSEQAGAEDGGGGWSPPGETMSEYEMFTMRNRLQFGRLHKAERGELYIAVPCGYQKLPSGQVVLEPDEQARAVIQMVFDKFDELGSQYAVLHYLIRNNLRIGIRPRCGPRRGELEWRRPSMSTVAQILHHPIYASAYVFGWRPPQRKGPSARLANFLPVRPTFFVIESENLVVLEVNRAERLFPAFGIAPVFELQLFIQDLLEHAIGIFTGVIFIVVAVVVI